MRFLIFFLLIGCASFRTSPPLVTPAKKKPRPVVSRDEALKKYALKDIPRLGKLSTTTDGDITTEFYRRADGETIITLEKGELRTEVEKRKSGLILTRTWQDGLLTSLTLSGTKRTTLVVFDRDGKFSQKIVTEKGKEEASCYQYEGEKALRMEAENCLELISGF